MPDAAAARNLADLAASWPLVTLSDGADGTTTLSLGGAPFAWITGDGLAIEVPPRVRDMLVETGRGSALPGTRRAQVAPDPDLLRLAYERARIAATPQAPDGRP
jgi:hypothetical protein